MFKKVLFFLLSFIFFLNPGCKKDLTPVNNDQPEIKLTVEDVGVTEAWLRLEAVGGRPEDRITITRDTITLEYPNTLTPDTLIYDSGLLPNYDYTYTAASTGSASGRLLSEVKITTMDTTNHDFTWEILTFGARGSSALYDVAIINENDIWCVGEIYTEDTYTYDSLGNWIEPYNVIHWDGNEWELKQYKHYLSYFTEPHWFRIDGIYAFSENDIWFANGIVHHYDSSYYNQHGYVKSYDLWDMGVLGPDDGGIKKIWGTSSNDLYGVGGKGTIVHYNGQTWRRIESGTKTRMQDIWGAINPKTNEWEIICAASPGYGIADSGLYRINVNKKVEYVPWAPERAARSVWFDNPSIIFACGSGIMRRDPLGQWQEIGGMDVIPSSTERIRGVASNDFYVVGHFGHVAHFNGVDFKVINPNSSVLYESCDYKNNLMVAVGYNSSKAYILKIWR